MAKCTIPFWNNGEPFEPVIYPEDLANHEDAEAAAQQEEKPGVAVLKAQAAFIAHVLEQTFPGQKADMKLTVAQIRGGFVELWTKGQDWRSPDAPLGGDGGSSEPLLSAA